MRVAIHFEPVFRAPEGYRSAIAYVMEEYGQHPSLYRRGGLPVMYFFAPYLISIEGWARIFSPVGDLSIRGSAQDIVALAQATNTSFIDPVAGGFFDGMYMYDVSGMTDLREMLHWPYLYAFAKSRGKIFIPSVGPGYDDRPIREGDRSAWQVERDGFTRYDSMWRMAIRMGFVPDYITVTSFNEWGEGTQIEPAIPHTGSEDYGTLPPDAYLDRTAEWVSTYLELLRGHPLALNPTLILGSCGIAILGSAAYRSFRSSKVRHRSADMPVALEREAGFER